jgi:hypothetical protein
MADRVLCLTSRSYLPVVKVCCYMGLRSLSTWTRNHTMSKTPPFHRVINCWVWYEYSHLQAENISPFFPCYHCRTQCSVCSSTVRCILGQHKTSHMLTWGTNRKIIEQVECYLTHSLKILYGQQWLPVHKEGNLLRWSSTEVENYPWSVPPSTHM